MKNDKKGEFRKPEAELKADADMRLDKYLKVSRIIKRRTVANEACDTGHVMLNGKEAKAGSVVKQGDIISVRYGDKLTQYEVTRVNAHAMKADAADMYRLIP